MEAKIILAVFLILFMIRISSQSCQCNPAHVCTGQCSFQNITCNQTCECENTCCGGFCPEYEEIHICHATIIENSVLKTFRFDCVELSKLLFILTV